MCHCRECRVQFDVFRNDHKGINKYSKHSFPVKTRELYFTSVLHGCELAVFVPKVYASKNVCHNKNKLYIKSNLIYTCTLILLMCYDVIVRPGVDFQKDTS